MLKIRLKRVGKRNSPSFRVVVTDSRQGPKSNKNVEEVGFYNPITKEQGLKGERITYWMSVGAQPSDRVYNMLVDAKIIEGSKKNVLPKKTPVVSEAAEEEQAAEATPAEESSNDAPESDETPAAEEAQEEEKKETDDSPGETQAQEEQIQNE